ncbi:uncharacterized protein LOC120769460 [Bactrocera tryoni]|uniref:uncharacterized protein LOC120769460 n=1 Tax=Bactrocera tryoni TaxID=59916 RepID=UPI001A96C3AC|nr:uncharacterized protein LOC120769460 [Bactrocera tryoni]
MDSEQHGRSRCSHFLSICFLASAMFKHKKFVGVSCPNGCKEGSQHIPVSAKNPFGVVTQTKEYNIGNDAPDDARLLLHRHAVCKTLPIQ